MSQGFPAWWADFLLLLGGPRKVHLRSQPRGTEYCTHREPGIGQVKNREGVTWGRHFEKNGPLCKLILGEVDLPPHLAAKVSGST